MLRATTTLAITFLPVVLAACSSLLPRAHISTVGPWQNYYEAQLTFEQIVPYQTTLEDLRTLKLDPVSNPNITILNYSDVIRRFIPNPSVNAQDLAPGVRECIMAKRKCTGYEVVQSSVIRKRYGGFWADYLNFLRKTEIDGWSFSGVILLRDDIVIYALAGGQPATRLLEENDNPLGPFQNEGESFVRGIVPFP